MKKAGLFLLLLLVFPLVSAISINIKSDYQPGETLLGTVQGNFLSQLKSENFYFYSDRTQLPLISDVAKIQDVYYFYALLPLDSGNYTLLIKDADYFENGREKIGDISSNFTISGNVTDFSVSPGFLVMRNESYLTVESLSQPLTVSLKFLSISQTISVPIAQKRKILISAPYVKNFTLANAEISALSTKYLIPIAVVPYSNATETENITSTPNPLKFTRSTYNFSVYEKNVTTFMIYLQNIGKDSIENISLTSSDTLNDTLTFSPDNIEELKSLESKTIEITISAQTYKSYFGKIFAYSDNNSAQASMSVNSIQEGNDLPISFDNTASSPTCMDKGGILCVSGQECSGTVETASDGSCCVSGICQAPTSYFWTVMGILLLVAIVGGLVYLYIKQRKAKMSSDDFLKKKDKSFEERLNPGTEVKGGLSRL